MTTDFEALGVLRHDMPRLVRRMQTEFRAGRGVRIGETTVASKRVHVIHPARPGEVRVVTSQDAGATFYSRRKRDEILHIDIFHDLAEVDHHSVADSVVRAVHVYFQDRLIDQARSVFFPSPSDLVNLIDIQTGTGGGRVGGALNCGRKPSLRRAHLSHVHLAAMLPDNCLAMLFYIVFAVERAVTAQGVEIRKIESIVHEEALGKADLSPYSSMFDSYLNESPAAGRGHDWEALPHDARVEAVAAMAEEFGGRTNMARLLDSLPAHGSIPPGMRADVGDIDDVVERLHGFDLMVRDRGRLVLTPKGRDVRSMLSTCASEIEAGMRRLIKRMPIAARLHRHEEGRFGARTRREKPAASRDVKAPGPGEWCDRIAVPETMVAALVARYLIPGRDRLIDRGDIRVYRQRPPRPSEVCLLIDASASMVGRRIRAAKYLIRHLACACRERISVLTFQERDVKTQIASTRSKRLIEEGVQRIEPAGLTPLAAGIWEALGFIRAKKLRNVLLVLITDGIPTMNRWTADPAKDALTAARRIAEEKIAFMCIGLQPNHDFLRKLSDIAHGKLYIVDEFDRDVLVDLVRSGSRESAGRRPQR